jgi:hypothetical protein
VIVMGIAADPQRVTVTDGRVLSFRPSDSIDPEYSPPAAVRSWLQYAYGICPPRFPLKAHDRRGLKKYWYLDVLRSEPPNPATISTVNCTTAASYELLRASTTTLLGFETWVEE